MRQFTKGFAGAATALLLGGLIFIMYIDHKRTTLMWEMVLRAQQKPAASEAPR